MKELPKIFRNTVSHNNNKTTFYSKNEDDTLINSDICNNCDDNRDTTEKLDDIINNINRFGFSKEVEIVTKSKRYKTRIVTRIGNYIITIDNEKIDINDILEINAN